MNTTYICTHTKISLFFKYVFNFNIFRDNEIVTIWRCVRPRGRGTSRGRSRGRPLSRRTRNAERQTQQRRSQSDEQRAQNNMELRTARSRSRASSTDSQRPINVRRDRVPRRRLDAMENVAFNYDCDADYSEYGCIGLMNNICPHCNAKKFQGETPGMCCLSGKVVLPALEPPPEPLDSLLNGQSPRSKHFLKNISSYNACFQMTSFGATKVIRDAMTFKVISSQGISNVLYNATKDKIFNVFRNSDPNSPYIAYTIQIQGQLYHRAGSLLPFADGDHQFLQIYFIGNETTELDQRCAIGSNTRRDIVLELQRFLHQNNELVKLFKVALERMPSDNHKIVIRADKTPVGQHARQFNAPTIDEVAIVIAGQQFQSRDIVLHRRSEQLDRVSELHRSYDALQYPLLFWKGDDGYHINMKLTDPATGNKNYTCSTFLDLFK